MGGTLLVPHLSLQNFRSHRNRQIEFDPLTIIIGPNGVGKTNILEAVWLVATSRSFRTNHESEMIAWNDVACHVATDGLTVRLTREPVFQKQLEVRGVIRRPLEYVGELPAVLFTPDSLNIITGPPAERRRFLDTILTQRHRGSARTLVRYRRILEQRNALLRQIAHQQAQADQLEPWDEELATTGSTIVREREDLVGELAQAALPYFTRFIRKETPDFSIHYQTTASPDRRVFLERLVGSRSRDLLFGTTQIGPHRDDVSFVFDGHPASEHASRGQLRSIILALKWAECHILTVDERRPVLLLDDLFSELDQAHRQALEGFLDTTQMVGTTTEPDYLPAGIRKTARIISLE